MHKDSPFIAEIRAASERFASREAADPDAYPAASVAELQAIGLLTAPFPPDLGGADLSLAQAAAAIEALAEASPSLALLASMPLGLAGVLAAGSSPLMEPTTPPPLFASFQGQVARVAADYRAGAIYAACNSEKGAGGSIAATKTLARRAEPPREGYLLTGDKILGSFGRSASTFFSTAKLPEGGVEMFFVDTSAPGISIRSDWDGFGMRSTESHSVRYDDAHARELVGYLGFLDAVQPLSYWWALFAAIPLGCVASLLRALGSPAPASPALRLRLSEALMRYEAARAYLLDAASGWRPAMDARGRARIIRAKTFVAEESARVAADLFALSGGRHYTRGGRVGRTFADAFAGAALRPPLPLALDMLVADFTLGTLEEEREEG